MQLLSTLTSGNTDKNQLMNMLIQFLTMLSSSSDPTDGSLVETEGENLLSDRRSYITDKEVAEIEGFRNFLSKALEVLDRKLKPSSRTPQEDEDAVSNPTKWTDLGRNLLRVLREKVDKSNGGSQG